LCLPAQWREAKPEEESPLFKSDVHWVSVDAEVLNGSRPVTGLGKGDFVIYDNGTRREITAFAAEKAALDVMLVFDVSGSMREAVAQVAASAREAIAQLKPGDRVGVMKFNVWSAVVQPLTTDLAAVQRGIQEVLESSFRGGTHLDQAIFDAAKGFLKEKPSGRRRAVLVITDNQGQRTKRDSTVIHALWEADATASGLLVNSDTALKAARTLSTILSPTSVITSAVLQMGMDKIADQTGGDVLKGDPPGPAFAQLMNRLRSRYCLYYSMPEGTAGEKREVRVELSPDAKQAHLTAKVYARKGYFLPAGNQQMSSTR
jgi:VWFA-related protein